MCREWSNRSAQALIKAAFDEKPLAEAVRIAEKPEECHVGLVCLGQTPTAPCPSGGFACTMCTRSFQPYSKFQMHMAISHNELASVSRRIDTAYCPVCLLLCHNRGCVIEHIGKSSLRVPQHWTHPRDGRRSGQSPCGNRCCFSS